MDDVLAQVLATIGSGGVIGGVFWLLVRSKFGEITEAKLSAKDASEEVKRLKDDTVKQIRSDLDRHVSQDLSQSILTEVKHLGNQNQVIGAKIDKFVADVAALQAQREGDRSYIENIDNSLQRHKETRHG